tara:strand:- start:842 stop:1303 length:462 start_codon:yes stop_codon:yes gene_type:complete
MIKTFRGRLADGEVQRIRLSTNKGEIGYKCIKFEAFPCNPAADNSENVLMLWRQKADAENADIVPSATNPGVDFSAPGLLAILYISNHGGEENYFSKDTVIIDSQKVNQDVFVTSKIHTLGSDGMNYYIELERMKLDANEATVATLKDMRGRE